MKKCLSILFLTALVNISYAQTKTLAKDSAREDFNSFEKKGAPTYVQEMPKYPGGDQALLDYIKKHIDRKKVSKDIHGSVSVLFIVDENGDVKNAEVMKGTGIGGGCDEEAVRVISSLPKWQPAKQNGKTVSVHYNVPVRF